jgi:hypothetical protein
VITAHTASREALLHQEPSIITASTNRHLLQPTKINKQRRRNKISEIQDSVVQGKRRSSSHSRASKPLLKAIPSGSSSSSGAKSANSQLVDLVVEDEEAENVERVRARKEGGTAWNETEPKHFV